MLCRAREWIFARGGLSQTRVFTRYWLALIGEWPDASEAELTPFMKVMISRDEQGRALIKTVDSLNLQDLTDANDDQIKAVTNLVWEIKGLFYALISGKASDVLADLNIGSGAKLSANLVADLTANIPRDVVISAQQQWLPNLATEMANRPVRGDQEQNGCPKRGITDAHLVGGRAPDDSAESHCPLRGHDDRRVHATTRPGRSRPLAGHPELGSRQSPADAGESRDKD